MVDVVSFELLLFFFCHLGNALSALGRKEDALLVWEQGYGHALHHSADLKQLLELEQLLIKGKQGSDIEYETNGAPRLQPETDSLNNSSSSENCKNKDSLRTEGELCGAVCDKSEICPKFTDQFDSRNKLHDEDKDSDKFDDKVNGSPDVLDKLSYNSESYNDSSDTSESCDKASTNSSDSIDITEIFRKPSNRLDFSHKRNDEARKSKKFCVARISKSKSITVDFRLSRGIAEVCFMLLADYYNHMTASSLLYIEVFKIIFNIGIVLQVNEGKYAHAVSIFDRVHFYLY